MKKLFTLCLLVFSLSASAQWQQTGSKVRYVNGIGIPTKDTAAGVAADSSQILIRPADSSLYVKYKRTWMRVGGGGGSIAGSGSTNYIAKFTSSSAIGNSQIFDNGTAVGIGTTSPANKLDVSTTNRTALNTLGSGVNVNYNGSNTGEFATIGFGWPSSIGNNSTLWGMGMVGSNFASGTAALIHFTNGSERMRITSTGNALIGTTTDNGTDKLQVSGSIRTSSNLQVDGLIGINTTPSSYSLNILGSGTNVTRIATQQTNNINHYEHSSSTLFGQIGNASGFNASGSTADMGVGSYNNLSFYTRSGTFFERARITATTGNLLISTTTDNSTDKLQVNGSIQGTGFNQAYTAKTATYTATTSDYFIDCTSGTFTVNLFTAVGNTGRIIIVKNSGTGTITVDPNGAQTIDGAATQSLSTQWSRVHIISDGANWKIISN